MPRFSHDVFCYIDKQYTKFSFLVSAGIFFAWGEGGGNRRILVMSHYNLPDLLIGLCNIFMIPLSTPHSQFSTVPLYTLTPPVSHEYVWPPPPPKKKSPPGNQWLFPSISSTPHFKRSSPAYTTHSTSSKLSPLDQQVKCQELQSISSVFDTSLVHSAPLQWGVDGMLTDLCLGCHRNTENGEVLFLDR